MKWRGPIDIPDCEFSPEIFSMHVNELTIPQVRLNDYIFFIV